MIQEKPALLRLRIKVYLGTKGIPQSHVWDEPSVMVEGEENPLRPDLIVVKDEGIEWWEMKAWKKKVYITPLREIFINKISKVREAKNVRFIRKDTQKEATNKKVIKVIVICGEGGFSKSAYEFAADHHFELMKPDDLGVPYVVIPRISLDRLLGVEIRIVPKGSKEKITFPKEINL